LRPSFTVLCVCLIRVDVCFLPISQAEAVTEANVPKVAVGVTT